MSKFFFNTLSLGTRYLLWVDIATQYSFFGINAILPLFLSTQVKLPDIKVVFLMQLFLIWKYLSMIVTTILAETILTPKILMTLSVIISFVGHVVLSYNNQLSYIKAGLIMIALGVGIVKICLQPLIVQQANTQEEARKSLSLLYICTNIGTISIIILPIIVDYFGYKAAFQNPIIVIVISFVILLKGNKMIKSPPLAKVSRMLNVVQWQRVVKYFPLIVIIAIFEAFFAQMYSSWVVQAEKMNCTVLGFTISPVQLQILDTIFIIGLIPVVAFTILPQLQKRNILTTLSSQISVGYFFAFVAFAVIACIQWCLEQRMTPSLLWQTPAFLFLSLAEIMIMCIVKNILYTVETSLRIKVSLSYAIFSLIMNSMISLGLQFFDQINLTFFTFCSICLMIICIVLSVYKALSKHLSNL